MRRLAASVVLSVVASAGGACQSDVFVGVKAMDSAAFGLQTLQGGVLTLDIFRFPAEWDVRSGVTQFDVEQSEDRYPEACGVKRRGIECWTDDPHTDLPERLDGDFKAVNVSVSYLCTLDTQGGPACTIRWGEGEGSPLPGLRGITAREIGEGCVLDVAGTITCLDDDGTVEVELDGDFVSLADGGGCGVDAGGFVTCPPEYEGGYWEPPPSDIAFTALSLSAYGGCGVTDEKSLLCWGPDYDPDPEDNLVGDFGVIGYEPAGNFIDVALDAYSHTACALDADGCLACWGDSAEGAGVPSPSHRLCLPDLGSWPN